jgi:5-methylcytosine-specific restriction endonuclease McrA
MPTKPLTPCRQLGCPELTNNGYCKNHLAINRSIYDREKRPKQSKKFYDSQAWRKVRKMKLAEQPQCEQCLADGFTVLASAVHHDKSIEEFPELALTLSNLVSICSTCHSRIEAQRRRGKK